MKLRLAVAAALSVALHLAPALAQAPDDANRASARALFDEALDAYQARDYATASEKLEKAYGLMRVPTLGLASARVLKDLGKLVEASERYRQVALLELSERDAAVGKLDIDAQRNAQLKAQSDLDALVPRIPTLVLQIAGARAGEVRLTVDDRPLPSELSGERLPMNPGLHRILAERGAERVAAEVQLLEAKTETLLLRFSEPDRPTKVSRTTLTQATPTDEVRVSDNHETDVYLQRWRTAGWISAGSGAGALLLGSLTTVLAMGDKNAIERKYGKLECPLSKREACDTYNALRTLSTVSLISGGLLAISGVAVLLWANPSEQASLRLEFLPLLGGAQAWVGLEL